LDSASGNSVLDLQGLKGHVSSVEFSPDGTLIVTSSDDTVKVWDAAKGELLTSLEGHSGDISSAKFSKDGKSLVTASGDHTAKIWDMRLETRSPAEIKRLIEQRVPYYLHDGRLIKKTTASPR
jgi:WD40 repeat protein